MLVVGLANPILSTLHINRRRHPHLHLDLDLDLLDGALERERVARRAELGRDVLERPRAAHRAPPVLPQAEQQPVREHRQDHVLEATGASVTVSCRWQRGNETERDAQDQELEVFGLDANKVRDVRNSRRICVGTYRECSRYHVRGDHH